MNMKRLVITCVALVGMVSAGAQNTIVVAQDGTGDYATIQEAVDNAVAGQENIIRIKAGLYDERVNIGTKSAKSSKQYSFIGEDIDKTIISSPYYRGDNAPSGEYKVDDFTLCPALCIYADNFYAENITFENRAPQPGSGQAEAIYIGGDRQTFYQCKFKGYQDTHRSLKNTRSYYKNCIVEGATDFLYAGGTCWFENCTLNCVAAGYITAPEDIRTYVKASDNTTKIYLGFIFNNCTVTRASGVSDGSVFLGRPWSESACGSLFMNCELNNAIKPAGWCTMGSNDGTKSYYGEFKNWNKGVAADVSQRIDWSHQLTDADYEKVNSWAKVDQIFYDRAPRTSKPATFDPEAVIMEHAGVRLRAFPTAEGFGKFTSGGRGCKVVEVTNLDDSGEGSLRWALTTAGKENATIVFRVTGTIHLQSDISVALKNVTIAGQTAPGQGILYRGGKLDLGQSDNVIIRNIRGRLGVNEDPDKTKAENFIAGGAIGIENATNIIVDHCTFGWSGEENMTMYDNHFTTVQWCIVHEGLYNAGHPKGPRGYGCQWGGSPSSYHHNLLAHNDSRSPRVNGASNASQDRNVFMEYFNNVNYNWGRQNSCYGGENEAGTSSSHECNFVGNYYKPGPARTSDSYFIQIDLHRNGKESNGPSVWYIADNVMHGKDSYTSNNWNGVNNATGYQLVSDDPEVPSMKEDALINPPLYRTSATGCLKASQFASYDDYRTPTETAQEAYQHVLAKAGTIHRDAIEERIVEEVSTGTAKYKGPSANKGGIIDAPADAEGWIAYPAATAVTDEDHDGMDDAWEAANGLDLTNPYDRNKVVSEEGYTALEVYLNSLMGEVIPFIPTGIIETNMDKTLKQVEVYSLNGSLINRTGEISGLSRGVYIIKKTFSDNSVKSVKVMR